MKRAEKENMAKEVHILASREWGQPQVLRRNVRQVWRSEKERESYSVWTAGEGNDESPPSKLLNSDLQV